MDLKFLKQNYVTKGSIEGFPLEIIDKMLERQFEQDGRVDISEFETCSWQGFYWDKTIEGKDFWEEVILRKNFNLFFERYLKEERPLPRVIEIRDYEGDSWVKRVVVMFKDGLPVCFNNAKRVEDFTGYEGTSIWKYWREVQEPTYKPFDFSSGTGDYLDLLGKKIVSRNGKIATIINKIHYNHELSKSWINNIDADYIFDEYVFEDGMPVGYLEAYED